MNPSKFDTLTTACTHLLHTYIGANDTRTYINRRLSIQSQQQFGFGYFPTQEQLQVLLTYLDKNEMLASNLLYEKHINQECQVLMGTLERHNLIMPYRDVYGTIIALVGRTLLDDNARTNANISKYKNTSFAKNKHLYGLYEAKQSIVKHNHVYLVEGQFDCIQAHSHGITNTVALGSANMSIEQLILLLRYTDKLYLLLDNDEAGDLGRERIMDKYGKHAQCVALKIPQGFKDLDEFLCETRWDGSQELCKVLT